MKNSVIRDSEYEYVYQELGNKQASIFETMKDLMVFCALLALRKELSRLPIERRSRDGIKLDSFKNEDKIIIDIIALEITKDIEILTNENHNEKISIFEELANAGMKCLYDSFNQVPSQVELRKFINENLPEMKIESSIDVSSIDIDSKL